MKMRISFILMILVSVQIYSKSLGVVGETFPVAEKSFLVLIEECLKTLLQSGAIDSLNKHWIKNAAYHANRPTPLKLERTQRSNTHYFVPEITLSQDIVDEKGKVLFTKGTYVNALSQMPTYHPCWLFFNGDDQAQLNWAKKQMLHCANPKLILTAGTIQSTENKLNSVIYFDQAGRITQKLKIDFVPARVIREGNQLRIDEQAIKENGDGL